MRKRLPPSPESISGKLAKQLQRSPQEIMEETFAVPHIELTDDAVTVDWEVPNIPERPKEKPKYEWREVPRATDVVAIGDLHGNWEAFIENGKSANILRVNGPEITDIMWIGGNTHAVFLGDILADRFLDGPRILMALEHLKKQAQKEGGDITLLAGNHDNWALSYLIDDDAGDDPADYIITRATDMRTQGIGLFALFTHINETLPDALTTSMQVRKKTSQMLLENPEKKRKLQKHIAEHPEIVERLTSYQLIALKDDTLFVHCSPTTEIADAILAYAKTHQGLDTAITHINTVYQNHLRAKLTQQPSPHTEEYKYLQRIFLATGNRTSYVDTHITEQLRALGVNTIVHGHDRRFNALPPDPQAMHIVSADQGAFSAPSMAQETRRSLVTIATNGSITYGAQGSIYRSAK